MKKVVKAASAFLSAAILSSALIISASAEETLSTKVTYKDDGTAVLEISASEWENQVRYTTDGSVPTKDSKLYFSPLEITEKTTIRIAEFEDDKKIKGIKKTIKPKTAPITFAVEQDYDDEKAYITLECETLGAKIYYTTDGSKPSEDSSLYLGPVEIDEKTKIRARAYCDGFATKTTYSKTVKVEEEPESVEEQGASEIEETNKETEKEAIKLEPADEEEKKTAEKIDYKFTYLAEKGYTYVTFLKQKNSNTICYTTDGTVPTKNSKKYSKRVKFTEPGIIRAKEYNKKGECVATIKLNVKIKCGPVEYSCIDIAVGTKTITMSTITEGATIYYTIDGTTPDPEYSSIYTQPITVGDASVVKAMAVKEGYKDGNVEMQYANKITLVLQDFDFSDPAFAQVAELFNTYRRKSNLSDVVLDEKLTEAANVRAKELSLIFDHKRPTGNGYGSVFIDYGINVKFSGEFIASACKTPEEFVTKIMSTGQNRQIFLDKGANYDTIGIGYYKVGNNTYWVAIFKK